MTAAFPRRRPLVVDLPPEVLRRIKEAFADGVTKKELSMRFGLSASAVAKALGHGVSP